MSEKKKDQKEGRPYLYSEAALTRKSEPVSENTWNQLQDLIEAGIVVPHDQKDGLKKLHGHLNGKTKE